MRQYIDSFAQPTAADTYITSPYAMGDPTIQVFNLPSDVAIKGAPFYIRLGSTIFDVTALGGTGNKTWSVTRDVRTADANYPLNTNVFLDHVAADHEALIQKALLVAKGYIIAATAAETPVGLAPSTDGFVLTLDSGEASGLRWGASSGGALTLLEQHAASSSAQLDFTSFISSSYDEYLIELLGIVPATDGASLLARMGSGGGPTYDTGSNYGWQYARVNTGGTVFGSGNASDTSIILAEGIKSTDCADGSYKLFRPQSIANNRRMMGDIVIVQNDGTFYRAMFGGQWKDTSNAMTALRFFMSSGNISSGTIRIYGIAK